MNSERYFLRNESESTVDIGLPDNKEICIGRGPKTKIKDSRVSRSHVRLMGVVGGVLVHQLGHNRSLVNGTLLDKGSELLLLPGQVLHLLEGKFPFRLFQTQSEGVKRDSEGNVKTSKVSDKEITSKMEDISDEKTSSKMEAIDGGKVKGSGHWSQGLLASMNDPKMKVLETENLVIIRDKYPKAEHHFLVLPKEKLTSLKVLSEKHVDLLEEMDREGRDICKKYPNHEFKLGYHAIPSMSQVHLHVISQDFNSECLKNKKHWNSFNTNYFILSKSVINEVRSKGRFVEKESAKDLLSAPLKCHKCGEKPKNMPDLKKHVITHL